MYCFLIVVLMLAFGEVSFADTGTAQPVLSAQEKDQIVVDEHMQSMRYVFNFIRNAAAAQKLRPIKQSARKARLHLNKVTETSVEDVGTVDNQIKLNHILLAAGEIEKYIEKILAAKNVQSARYDAKKAAQIAQDLVYPESHSMLDVDLDYDNLFRS